MHLRILKTVVVLVVFAAYGNSFGASSQTPGMILETRAFAGACLSSSGVKAAPLIAALIPTLIEKSVTALASALREAGKAKNVVEIGTINLQSISDIPQCVYLIRGELFTNRTDHEGTGQETAKLLGLRLKEFAKLIDEPGISETDLANRIGANAIGNGIYLAKPPILFLEARVISSADKKAYALRPSILVYNQMFESGFFLGTDSRDLVVAVGLVSAGQEKGQLQPTTFRSIRPPVQLVFDQDKDMERLAWDTPWSGITAENGPSTLLLSITETRSASQFLTFLADVLDGSKEDVTDALKQIALKSERVKVEQAQKAEEFKRREDQDKLLSEAVTNFTDAQQALLKCKEGAADASARLDLWADYQKKRLVAVTAVAKADPSNELGLNVTAIPALNECPKPTAK